MKRILYLGNKLSKHGKNPTGVETLGAKLALEGFEVCTASSCKNPALRLLDMWWQIAKNQKDTDIVLIDTYSTLNFYYALSCAALCRFFKLPYIPILHGGNLPKRFQKNPRLCRFLFGHAQMNVAPSAYTEQALKKLGVENVKIIPNYLELDLYPFKERKQLRPHLLWVRAFKQIYRPEWAVQVALALKEKGYPIKLCMVGPLLDDTFEKCKKLAEEHSLNAVFTGKLSKQAWINLSKEYDIFLNTSQVDNLPVSVLEAMALGLVVVSVKTGGLPFIFKDKTHLIFIDDGFEDIVSKVEGLVVDAKIVHKLQFKGRLMVNNMSWDKIKQLWIETLQNKK